MKLKINRKMTFLQVNARNKTETYFRDPCIALIDKAFSLDNCILVGNYNWDNRGFNKLSELIYEAVRDELDA